MISSVVSSASRGDSSMPSAGMQYEQRRLHRSVSEMRRYVCMRLRAHGRSIGPLGAGTVAVTGAVGAGNQHVQKRASAVLGTKRRTLPQTRHAYSPTDR